MQWARNHRMKRLFALLVLIGLLVTTIAPNLRAEVSPEQVRQAIDRAVAYLRQQQRNDGSWPDWPGQPNGVSALATLALLNAGVQPSDPGIQKALSLLRKDRPEMTYVVALQTMVFCEAEPQKDLLAIVRNVKWIEKTQIRNGPRKGSWSYPRASGDNSNSQFALLALHAAEGVGVRVNHQTWRWAKAYWEGCQNTDGSWGYYKGMPGTGSMTCAGIASLVIASGKVHESDARVIGQSIRCCQRGTDDDRIRDGQAWLGRNFTVTGNPGVPRQIWLLYYLYGVERVGRLTAQRFIDGHDWYREGTDMLVRNQDRLSGFWKGVGHAENNPHVATSLALLFLAKGRRPVLIAKLKHQPDNDWDNHRHDLANLTQFVEKQWKRDLIWQIVDLDAASVDDLVQSPVLYYGGKENPLPDNNQQRQQLAQKIRDYIDRGGFLFAGANCDGVKFDQGFRELMKLVFPEREYRLRLLPSEHPIWRAEKRVDPKYVRPLLGIDFGCRTSVVYVPPNSAKDTSESLSCFWELAQGGRSTGKLRGGNPYASSVSDRVDAALSIGINVLAYATNRELKYKDEIPRSLSHPEEADAIQRGRLRLATLRHPGGCNAAPRALVNLLEAASGELKIRINPIPRQLNITDDRLFDYHLVFMHGRTAFRLTAAERKVLRAYLQRGGMLFADSICASKAFTESFKREMVIIFPEHSLERIPDDDPLLTTRYGGFDLSTVTRRDPQSPGRSEPLKSSLKKVPPTLEGIKLGDRWGVVFSPYDVSCALEKHDSIECQAYVRKDAARIGLNVILYSMQQ